MRCVQYLSPLLADPYLEQKPTVFNQGSKMVT